MVGSWFWVRVPAPRPPPPPPVALATFPHPPSCLPREAAVRGWRQARECRDSLSRRFEPSASDETRGASQLLQLVPSAASAVTVSPCDVRAGCDCDTVGPVAAVPGVGLTLDLAALACFRGEDVRTPLAEVSRRMRGPAAGGGPHRAAAGPSCPPTLLLSRLEEDSAIPITVPGRLPVSLAGHPVVAAQAAAVQAAAAQAAVAAQAAALEQLREKLESGEPPEKKMALVTEEQQRLVQRALQQNFLAMTAQLPMSIRINSQGSNPGPEPSLLRAPVTE